MPGYLATTATPVLTGTVSLPSTTSIGNVSDTEISYLDGVTGPVQTQINKNSLIFIDSKTVSGASSGTLDNVFTSSYENYKIVLRCTFASSTYLNMRLRIGGASYTSGTYSWAQVGASSAAGAAANDFGGGTDTRFGAIVGSSGGTLTAFGSWDIFSPQRTDYTSIIGSNLYSGTANGLIIRTIGGQMSVTTQFDGVEFYTQSAANWNGIFSVYAYK